MSTGRMTQDADTVNVVTKEGHRRPRDTAARRRRNTTCASPTKGTNESRLKIDVSEG